MRVALVRHPTPLIGPGICYGRLDIAMDPAAEPQVARIVADPRLLDMRGVWTSPARRCREVADAAGRTLGVTPVDDPRLLELDFGEWEGQSWDSIARADLDRWAAGPLDFAPPGGETGAALIVRVRAFFMDLCRHGRDCVVVSHGGPLKVLAALLKEQPVDLLASAPPIASVRIVSYTKC
jgi:alpha-ribazole phosphatase